MLMRISILKLMKLMGMLLSMSVSQCLKVQFRSCFLSLWILWMALQVEIAFINVMIFHECVSLITRFFQTRYKNGSKSSVY